ncbi:hypothetical protein M0R04_10380 [Candidatus Dojkabacteria bacterium]|jgi:hypothetical protein|nr:hypothetical protein [Candidatus Dojkabacteria bacterium]
MKKLLHTIGIHDWKYETPAMEKVKEPEFFGNALTGGTYSGKYVEGYRYFQKKNCKKCSPRPFKFIEVNNVRNPRCKRCGNKLLTATTKIIGICWMCF